MIFFPTAKINIGLRITEKRPDGFHNIETIFYPVGLSDALEFVVSDKQNDKDNLIVTGIDTGSEPENNLIIKAILSLRKHSRLPILKIHLHKAIPVGAGLGGGSSDAACFLKVVNKHLGLNINIQTLKSIALELGSDCPFFIDCTPSYGTGRGEILTPVKPAISGYYIILLNPGVGINTGEAYRNCIPGIPSDSLLQLIERPIPEWKGLILNDFEEYAFQKNPIIGELKEALYKCDALFSLMSGSGSSVYGIFKEKPILPVRLENFKIWEGKL